MSEAETTGEATETQTTGEEAKDNQSFTQADIDRIVRERVKREREKFADYDDLKKKAEGAKTLEDRVAEIEANAKKSDERAVRAEIANEKGLTPSQAKRLVGSTREELEADADELLKDIGATKKKNTVPREGKNIQTGDDPMRATARALFGTD
jgi:nucleoid DNA-binding protein